MYLSIIFLPFIGAFWAGIFGRKIGSVGSQWVTTGCIFVTSILSIIAFYEVGLNSSAVSINLTTWIDVEPIYVSFGFLYDDLTISILLAIVIVSFFVHIYSISYIANDPHNQRFFSYLSFFTAIIILLVTADNYLLIFLGWEGIGIASFLLIGFWLSRIQANKAAVKALTINRVGDTFLSIGLFSILWTFNSLEYSTISSLTSIFNETSITIISLFLFVGAISKSAQVPLFTWLPDSIEG